MIERNKFRRGCAVAGALFTLLGCTGAPDHSASPATSGGSTQGGTTSSTSTGGVPAEGGASSVTSSGGAGTGGSEVGGSTTLGATGGSATGGAGTGGSGVGGSTKLGATGGSATGGAGTGGSSACVAPALRNPTSAQIALSGFTSVSYGGYLNGESFQEDGILSYKGYQYTAFWNTNRQVVMARRKLSPSATDADGAWEKFDFTDYTNTEADAHNTISLGVSPADGALHLSFDHHSSTLHYRKSKVDLMNDPGSATWAAASFTAVSNALVAGTAVAEVTYPRFITEPGGAKMLFSARLGTSGSGDEHLWEYTASAGTWAYIGKYLDGISASVNAYPHGLSYTRAGSRLHISWCWRATPDATTNFDLYYMYSDDNGRTWKNNGGTAVATTGTTSVTLSSSSNVRVWTINQNRGLINQEHMAVDSAGRVHVLLSHMPDSQADDSNFTSARTKAQYFHYMRDTNGTWVRHVIANTPVMLNFRGKFAISSSNTVYAVLPIPAPSNAAQSALRILAASTCDNYAQWAVLATNTDRAYFSDPLIDTARLASENELTIYYPQQTSVNIWGLEYTLN